MILENLEPKEVFHFFEEISTIPRGSFDTKRISDYCVKFAEDRGLRCIQDSVNNIIIFKGGTNGYEASEPVIIQGHLDMVCEKRPESAHDFKNDSLELYVEDGYVKAKDTTLGGDDGIAVAMALALLDNTDIPHPPIEAVFTVDEEVNLIGAEKIDLSVLKGKKLINIDSEEEGILTVGCAGGLRVETEISVEHETGNGLAMNIRIHGLLGGHSGAEIHKQRGNAHKMMGRLLNKLSENTSFKIITIEGGSKDNVISGESIAKILIQEQEQEVVSRIIHEMFETWKHEFQGQEPNLQVDVTAEEAKNVSVFTTSSTERIISYLALCPNGVQCYDRELEGLVETSLNLGVVENSEQSVRVTHLIRSSKDSKKYDVKEQLVRLAKLIGGKCDAESGYPAWEYKQDSVLRPLMIETYEEQYGEKPVVATIHAGLECGLFLGKKPDLDCVSIGPNIHDIHSFNEKLDIASVERTWKYVKTILAKLK